MVSSLPSKGFARSATFTSSAPALGVLPSNSSANDFWRIASGAVSEEKNLPCIPSKASLLFVEDWTLGRSGPIFFLLSVIAAQVAPGGHDHGVEQAGFL